MNKLCKNDGSEITDQKAIIEEVASFYKQLYNKKEVEEFSIGDLVIELNKLTEEENNELEGEISLEEAGYALKNMANGKSPGTDGFTSEFFKFFWLQLGSFVVRSLNEGFIKGEMSSSQKQVPYTLMCPGTLIYIQLNSQKQGLITCLPKGDKPRLYLKNWQPITLLNIVYKIGSACIANGIKPVLSKLVNEDQTVFVKGRYLGDSIRTV